MKKYVLDQEAVEALLVLSTTEAQRLVRAFEALLHEPLPAGVMQVHGDLHGEVWIRTVGDLIFGYRPDFTAQQIHILWVRRLPRRTAG